MNKPHELALPVTLPGVCATTARRSPSLDPRRAVTFIRHDQTEIHGTGGATHRRFGAYGARVPVPARVHLVRERDCTSGYDLLTNYGRCFCIGRLFEQYGIGRRSTALQAILIQYGRQGTFQRLAKGPHNHLKASVRYVPKPKDGAERDVGTITQGLGND